MDEPQLTRSVDDPDTTPSLGQRLRRWLWIPGRMLAALFLPDRSMRGIVNAERASAAILLCMLCAGLSSWVVGSRIDMTSSVLEEETWRQKWDPQAETRSDRDINDQIAKDKAIFQVKMGLRAGVWIPLEIALLSLGLYAASRFVGGRPKMKRVFVAAAYSQLPFALKNLAFVALAWNHPVLVPADIDKLKDFADLLIPIHQTGGAFHIDFFNVWSHVILVFGIAAAAEISRLRALALVTVKFIIFTLFTGGAPRPRFMKPMPGRGN